MDIARYYSRTSPTLAVGLGSQAAIAAVNRQNWVVAVHTLLFAALCIFATWVVGASTSSAWGQQEPLTVFC
jgi:hypothetical protein